MRPLPISLLREALSNLAAEPVEQLRRLAGSVVTDELALDFANAYEALASLAERDTLESGTMDVLELLYDQMSVESQDPLWAEDLSSERWSRIRFLAADAQTRL